MAVVFEKATLDRFNELADQVRKAQTTEELEAVLSSERGAIVDISLVMGWELDRWKIDHLKKRVLVS